MAKNMLLVIILILTLAPLTVGRSAAEMDLALAAVGSGPVDEIKGRLFTTSINVLSDEYRAQAAAVLPSTIRTHRITRGKLFQRVERVFGLTLDLHGRAGKVELFFFHDDVPLSVLWRDCVLAISDGLAEPLYDEELASIISHELGHSYFMDEMAAAQKKRDAQAMRVVELKCDAVALLSLKLLGLNPACYLRGLQRVQTITRRKGLSTGIFQSHPELVERAQFAQRLIKLLA